MDSNSLKKFACEARIKLIDIVSKKLEYVLTQDTAELRGKKDQISKLNQEIKRSSKQQVVERVAYLWFNRMMALRFMDANGYTNPKVVTPAPGNSLPEILQEAKAGHIDEILKIDKQRLNDLLDGRTTVSDAQTEAYKLIFIAICNSWNPIMPFMFEKISDYSELLLPDDLLSDFSVVTMIRVGMTEEDCANVEIIGWLYQFYISEENERLISSKKVYSKNELAPASQLFTPDWIVKYLVDNTLGQLLSEYFPDSKVIHGLEYYIKPQYLDKLPKREIKKLEEIKFFDPCVGSAHILAYSYDVFYKMYEEQGYDGHLIPELIISNNLYGTDIDERAAQLASFVIMMKGRQSYSRILRKKISPNIAFYRDFENDNKFRNAKALGSLIRVTPNEINYIRVEEDSIFEESQVELKKLYSFLGHRYDLVVTNPPYISSSRMEATLKKYVETAYPATKSDLFATFILRCLELCKEDGLTGYMTPFVWMFISSYQPLREIIIDNYFINNLIQLEYSGFEGATVPICTFTLRKNMIIDSFGSYIRLSDFKGPLLQAPKTLEAIKNSNCDWFYTANQKDFEKIPGFPISYWTTSKAVQAFSKYPLLKESYTAKSGVMTGDDEYFIRFWYELPFVTIGFKYKSEQELVNTKHNYFPLNKEEGFRKWGGRYISVLFYKNNGANFENYEGLNYRLRDQKFYFRKGISWGDVTSSLTSYRYQEEGLIFAARAPMIFTDNIVLCGILNSKIIAYLQKIINPTLSFNLIDLEKMPIAELNKDLTLLIEKLVKSCITITDEDWRKNELSWDFQQNELLKLKEENVEKAWEKYKEFWVEKFLTLHKNEEEVNKLLIDIYELTNELSSHISFPEITILQDESEVLGDNQLRIKKDVVLRQLLSYTVGCFFGRFSYDKPGLILANKTETIEDFLKQIPQPRFLPDEDNIVPVLEGEYFIDDIVGRFNEFIKVAFGPENYEENIKFVEDAIGKNIRKYFVKDFYTDHIKRYKNRPIYWMFSSAKGNFKVLIYMHRYRPDTVSKILNDYLRVFIGKLEANKQSFTSTKLSEHASARERTIADKKITEIESMLKDCKDYEKTLFEVAAKRIEIDLDDGVKVNYLKFRDVLVPIKGLDKGEE